MSARLRFTVDSIATKRNPDASRSQVYEVRLMPSLASGDTGANAKLIGTPLVVFQVDAIKLNDFTPGQDVWVDVTPNNLFPDSINELPVNPV